MSFRTKAVCGFAVGIAIAVLTTAAPADDKVIKPVKQWNGIFTEEAHEPLRKEAPKSGFIADAETWAKLCKAWGIEADGTEIDFKKQLVLVSTAGGAVNTWQESSIKLTDKGDLVVKNTATEKASAGFIYLIQVVDREGVKSVNGKPLAARQKPPAPPVNPEPDAPTDTVTVLCCLREFILDSCDTNRGSLVNAGTNSGGPQIDWRAAPGGPNRPLNPIGLIVCVCD